MTITPSPAARALSAAALALITVALWWAWLGHDTTYYFDQQLQTHQGPYRAWQVAGCALTLVAVAVVAVWRLPLWVVVIVLPAALTLAWSWRAAEDSSGMWIVGAVMVYLGSTAAAALVGGLTAFVRRELRRDHPRVSAPSATP
ncbi:hypothetical protein [Pilimelia columellifera]|uniref:Transmembrane protein n=1 Tax=Pilimelia columellifera subsp. columellifera TaxID=706583 RepID=A0ABP6AM53_9ACTN